MLIMKDNEIKEAIYRAIEAVKAESPPFDYSAGVERSVAHRLAVQMELGNCFSGLNIDCEYNRHGRDTKQLLGIRECSWRRKTDRISPDIIVHNRTKTGAANNLLVVEMKMNSKKDMCDLKKLELFTTKPGTYEYQLGLYINVKQGEFVPTWYKDGQAEHR